MDHEKIKQLTAELISAIGEDPEREGLVETPKRVAKSYDTLFGGYQKDPKDHITVFDGEDYDEMIICRDIDFYSTCEHHMLPFFGKAYVGYLPNKKIIGISKIPRIIEIYARRLQNQERLTMQIAQAITDLLNPKGVGVVIKAQHLCMMSRGVERHNAVITTSSFTKLFRSNQITRSEFIGLIKE
jgi:GTP cyclohydrolase I